MPAGRQRPRPPLLLATKGGSARLRFLGQGYGITMAEMAALTYGRDKDDAVLRESGVARAEAMAYRDARGRGMTAEDWAAIETQLLRACQLLKAAARLD